MGRLSLVVLAVVAASVGLWRAWSSEDDESYEDAPLASRYPIASTQMRATYGSVSQRLKTDCARPRYGHTTLLYPSYRLSPIYNSRLQSTYTVPAQTRPRLSMYHWTSKAQAHVNRKDFIAAQRAPAEKAYSRMQKAQEEKQRARSRDDKSEVVRLTALVAKEKATAERLEASAAECIFKETNKGRKPNNVDLHGLYVLEAIKFAEKSIKMALSRSFATLTLIVGKGLHSSNSVAKLKPAIENMLKGLGLVATGEKGNTGALIVPLRRLPGKRRIGFIVAGLSIEVYD